MQKSECKLPERLWFSYANKIIPAGIILLGVVGCLLVIYYLEGVTTKTIAQNIGGTIALASFVAAFFAKCVLHVLEAKPAHGIRDAATEVFYGWLTILHGIPLLGEYLRRRAVRRERQRNPFTSHGGDAD